MSENTKHLLIWCLILLALGLGMKVSGCVYNLAEQNKPKHIPGQYWQK